MIYYVSHMLRIMVWLLPLYCLARVWVVWRKKVSAETVSVKNVIGDSYVCREIVLALFMLFMAGLLTLTFGNGVEEMRAADFEGVMRRIHYRVGINIVPFRTIRNYFRYAQHTELLWVNIVGNIIMFIPWGFCLPLLWERFQCKFRMTLMCLILPVLIEFIQLFVGRSVDVDDIILNFVGGILGCFLFWGTSRIFPDIKKLALRKEEEKYGT